MERDLQELYASLRKLPVLMEAKEGLRSDQGQPLYLSGLCESARIFAALTLAEGEPFIYLAPDPLSLRRISEVLSALLGYPVPVLHARASDYLGSGTRSRIEDVKRLACLSAFLNHESPVLLADGRALFDRLPKPEEILNRQLQLQVGSTCERQELLQRLIEAGYERRRQVEAPGQMAIRGDLIDIGLPAAASPVGEELGLRLSFFDIELEDLRLFRLSDQRSVESLQSYRLPPVVEHFVPKERRAHLAAEIRAKGAEAIQEFYRSGGEREGAEKLRQLIENDALALENERESGGIQRWDFLLRPEAASLLDYAKHQSALLFVDEPARLRERLDAAEAEFQQEAQQLLLRYQAIPDFFSVRRRPDELMGDMESCRILMLSQLSAKPEGAKGLQLSSRAYSADHYRGRESFLFDDLRRWRDEKWQIVLCASSKRRRERLREILNEASLTLPISELSLGEGFVWKDAKVAILGEINLFGQEKKQRKRQREGSPIRFFSDLNPGDLVVHDEHGIGRYLGIETVVIEGVHRDYLHLQYRGDGSLFLPVDRLDEIQKYLGGDKRQPQLSQLGGKDWEKQKSRASESIRKLATDLLDVYAKRQSRKGHAFSPNTVWQEQFEENFPYTETEDQLQALAEIKADMESDKIMDRLLCGDVGFGKTELAFRALFKAVMDGKQGAFIAPTTVLAQQHYDSFKERLGDFPIRFHLLTRFVSGDRRKAILKEAENGEADLIIGTHRLLSGDLHFKDLGLLVIDEEQRFGVDHKETLKARNPDVDVLTLTATPIPRTLHMSMTGLRDISVLENGPDDRRPVQTYVMEYDAAVVDEAILREIGREGQVFYLCNDTRKLSQKVRELMERLPGARITMAHGRMSERVLEDAINGFSRGDFDILVCTTIIESGIDMPNVNTIIIEDADRLGLSQLYQIRGRVGRSGRQAYAYICYKKDKILSEEAEKRLTAIRDFTELGSGFRIALRDLEVRGAGNLLGGEQSGHLDAVGYELYCRLLEESIRSLKGEAPEEKSADCLIDLPIDALIPAEYIQDSGERMDLYRRALAIRDGEGWRDVLDELIDRYGNPPQAVINLLDIALARARATALGIERIEKQSKDLLLSLKGDSPATAELMKLFQKEDCQGKLLFHAGTKPYILYKSAAEPANEMGENLRRLFIS